MIVPIVHNQNIVIMACFVGKPNHYNSEDTVQAQMLLSRAWSEVQQHRMEEREKKLTWQLQQSQKMEAVERLAGGIAHDFNNILQAMLGCSEMLRDTLPGHTEAQSLLEDIITEGKRASALTSKLLALARQQIVRPRTINLSTALPNLLPTCQSMLGESIELHWHPSTAQLHIKIDPDQLDQILANLMVNARDAIAGAGVVGITISSMKLSRDFCASYPNLEPGEYVLLEVSDNGGGMTAEVAGRVFEPFYSTKSLGSGTGLGLSTVYGIVTQNNGIITVESTLGVGSVFRIYLPAQTADDSVEVREVVTPEGMVATGHETILVVDDEELMLRAVHLILQNLGYHVLSALGPERALEISRTYNGNIDLLLTDVVMPKYSGHDLQSMIKSERPSIKCIYMSGYTADIIASHGILEEGVFFIAKPFTRLDLSRKLREVLTVQ